MAPIIAGPAPSGTAPSASVKAKMQKTSTAVIHALDAAPHGHHTRRRALHRAPHRYTVTVHYIEQGNRVRSGVTRTSATNAPTGLTSAAVGTMPKAPWKMAVEAADPRLTCSSRGGIQRRRRVTCCAGSIGRRAGRETDRQTCCAASRALMPAENIT